MLYIALRTNSHLITASRRTRNPVGVGHLFNQQEQAYIYMQPTANWKILLPAPYFFYVRVLRLRTYVADDMSMKRILCHEATRIVISKLTSSIPGSIVSPIYSLPHFYDHHRTAHTLDTALLCSSSTAATTMHHLASPRGQTETLVRTFGGGNGRGRTDREASDGRRKEGNGGNALSKRPLVRVYVVNVLLFNAIFSS